MRIFKQFLPVLALVLSLVIPTICIGAEIEIMPISAPLNTDINVYVRIEAYDGVSGGTLLTRTPVALDITAQEQYTALEVLQLATDGDVDVEESEYGTFVTGILGVSQTDNQFWMYTVNDEIAAVGMADYVVQESDELVFYLYDWTVGAYAYFTPMLLTVEAGETFTLTLTGLDYMGETFAVADAALYLDGPEGAPMTRDLKYTDENGEIKLTFYYPGDYTITASKYDADELNTISRPYSLVTVLETDKEPSPPDMGDAEALPEPTDPQTTETDEPILVPTPPALTADPATGQIILYGRILATAPAPVMSGETVMIPFRAVMEALGAMVGWEPENRIVSADYEGKSIRFALGDTLDGVTVMVIEDRTFVPLSYIVSQFGL